MLDKKVFKDGMQKLLYVFPKWNVELEEKAVIQAWYEYFKDDTVKEFETKVKMFIKNEEFPPTVAGLNKYHVKKLVYKSDSIEDEEVLKMALSLLD